MKRSLLLLPLMLLSPWVPPACAQHLWFDVDHDGQCTSTDVLSSSVTQVDIYIDTETNQDGTPAVCSAGDGPLTLTSFSLIVTSPGGGITFRGWGRPAGFALLTLGLQGNDAWIQIAPPAPLDPGTHWLGLVLVSVSGNPSLAFAASTPYEPAMYTGFGSACSGTAADHVIRYPIDFTGVCNTSTPTPVEHTTWGRIKALYR